MTNTRLKNRLALAVLASLIALATIAIPASAVIDDPCPEGGMNLEAEALDGGIVLTFDPVAGSDGTNIYRAEGAGPLEYLATVTDDDYIDSSVVDGTAYVYALKVFHGENESFFCDRVEVSAIPVFPGMLGLSLATGLGAIGYAFARRKK